jgi:flagellin-specific chaperone FliS
MLRDAHKGLEAMSAVANAVKNESWADAARELDKLQEIVTLLKREVGDKAREVMQAPTPDRGDRG